jgi:hypothetical protein
VGLERVPLSPVNTIEELLWRKSNGSGLETQEYGRGDPPRWPRDTLCPQKLELTSPARGGRSVGIVRSRTQATEVFVIASIQMLICKRIRFSAPHRSSCHPQLIFCTLSILLASLVYFLHLIYPAAILSLFPWTHLLLFWSSEMWVYKLFAHKTLHPTFAMKCLLVFLWRRLICRCVVDHI